MHVPSPGPSLKQLLQLVAREVSQWIDQSRLGYRPVHQRPTGSLEAVQVQGEHQPPPQQAERIADLGWQANHGLFDLALCQWRQPVCFVPLAPLHDGMRLGIGQDLGVLSADKLEFRLSGVEHLDPFAREPHRQRLDRTAVHHCLFNFDNGPNAPFGSAQMTDAVPILVLHLGYYLFHERTISFIPGVCRSVPYSPWLTTVACRKLGAKLGRLRHHSDAGARGAASGVIEQPAHPAWSLQTTWRVRLAHCGRCSTLLVRRGS